MTFFQSDTSSDVTWASRSPLGPNMRHHNLRATDAEKSWDI